MNLSVLNAQPVEKPEYDHPEFLDIVDCFYTIQGEGPFSGEAAVFLRLAGCNLDCSGCDTNYTEGRKRIHVEELSQKIVSLMPGTYRKHPPLLVITGGEPFRQNLYPLTKLFVRRLWRVQIETNGTLFDPDFPYERRDVHLVCSPKTPGLNKDIIPYLDYFKYILDADHVSPDDGLPTSVLGKMIKPYRAVDPVVKEIYVQPEDDHSPEWTEKNRRNVQAAVRSCMMYGYRLSLQTHKIVGLP